MIGRALAVLVFTVGVGSWTVGVWQVYESNTLLGAVLVLTGALLMVSVIAWWRRRPDAGFEAVWQGIYEFFNRA